MRSESVSDSLIALPSSCISSLSFSSKAPAPFCFYAGALRITPCLVDVSYPSVVSNHYRPSVLSLDCKYRSKPASAVGGSHARFDTLVLHQHVCNGQKVHGTRGARRRAPPGDPVESSDRVLLSGAGRDPPPLHRQPDHGRRRDPRGKACD